MCIDKLNINAPKTKAALEMLAQLGLNEALIITDTISEELHLATRNLARVAVINSHEIDPYSLVGFDRVLITGTALEKVEKWLGPETQDSVKQLESGGNEATERETPDGSKEDE